jgi:hypothetical protein
MTFQKVTTHVETLVCEYKFFFIRMSWMMKRCIVVVGIFVFLFFSIKILSSFKGVTIKDVYEREIEFQNHSMGIKKIYVR